MCLVGVALILPRVNHPPRMRIATLQPSPEEAAAIVAALERFMRDTAPPPSRAEPPPSAWRRAALLEGVGSEAFAPFPWVEPDTWG